MLYGLMRPCVQGFMQELVMTTQFRPTSRTPDGIPALPSYAHPYRTVYV